MAIEFQCPHCQATMKAPDDAGGKSSRCPQCQTKLIVPVVEIPPVSASPQEQSQQPVAQPFPVGNEQYDSPTPTEQASNSDFINIEKSTRNPSPTLQRLHRRSRQQMPTWLIPVSFGGIILAVLVFLYFKVQPELKGTGNATTISEPIFKIQRISREGIDVDKSSLDTVLEDLAKQSHVFKTPQITCMIQGDPHGLNIQLEQATRTKIVRVNLRSKSLLREFLIANRSELSKVKQSTLESALKDFVNAFAAAIKENQPMDDSLRYFYDIGLNSQVDDLGFHIRARYANKTYHCIYEDEQGVYFAMPEHAKRFQIIGRKLKDSRVLLPVNYDISIRKTSAKPATD